MNGNSTIKQQTVAVLGTGKMGSAIAARLADCGFDIVLWNRTRSRAEQLNIGTVAETAPAATRRADIIVSSLTGPEAVRDVYIGLENVVSAGKGKLFIEMSTAGPEIISQLAPKVIAAGAGLISAPIMGAPPAVRAGNAAILVGGSDKDVKIAGPVLSALGAVRHVGSIGTSARLKLVANSMLADVMLTAAELQIAGEHAGLKADDVFWVLQRVVPILGLRRAGFVEGRHVPALFAMRDLSKDIHLARKLFDGFGMPLPITDTVRQLVDSAAIANPNLDITAVAKLYRQSTERRVSFSASSGDALSPPSLA
ncbi:MAG: NAD(P)-dependent oxidoreductase [Rhodanobacteraceae bacterium]